MRIGLVAPVYERVPPVLHGGAERIAPYSSGATTSEAHVPKAARAAGPHAGDTLPSSPEASTTMSGFLYLERIARQLPLTGMRLEMQVRTGSTADSILSGVGLVSADLEHAARVLQKRLLRTHWKLRKSSVAAVSGGETTREK